MRERMTRSRDPPTARPGPTIASRASNSQPPLALACRCSDAATRGRTIAIHTAEVGATAGVDRPLAGYQLAPQCRKVTFGRQRDRSPLGS